MKESPIKKLYYSIREVSQITSLKPHILRYWETEFIELKPSKNRAGKRIYRLNDIKTIFLIKKLLYVDKYTFEGTRQQLKSIRQNKILQLKLSLDDLQKNDLLLELKKDLEEMQRWLNQPVEGETASASESEVKNL